METIEQLMRQLDGADAETVNRIAWEKGSLSVRLAMLGLASIRKGENALWWGYPPGVFISYKWDGEPMRHLVMDLAEHVRGLGYRAFLDVENLDEDADAYFQIPQFITSLQDCTFYILLLTELSAGLMTGSMGKTTWIHDEYQHAVRLANAGRLSIIPVLLEPGGETDFFTPDNCLDLTKDQREFSLLNDMLRPGPVALSEDDTVELTVATAEFDRLFLGEGWQESLQLLQQTRDRFGHTFDHQFRRMLHAIYTADGPSMQAALDDLHGVYGERLVQHIYRGYCVRHGIPDVSTGEQPSKR